ncbi:hypothetical protein GCM10010273_17090 [Streptomyces lavendulocolor]
MEPDTSRCGHCRETWEIHDNRTPGTHLTVRSRCGWHVPLAQGAARWRPVERFPHSPGNSTDTLIEVPARSVRKVMRNDNSLYPLWCRPRGYPPTVRHGILPGVVLPAGEGGAG